MTSRLANKRNAGRIEDIEFDEENVGVGTRNGYSWDTTKFNRYPNESIDHAWFRNVREANSGAKSC